MQNTYWASKTCALSQKDASWVASVKIQLEKISIVKSLILELNDIINDYQSVLSLPSFICSFKDLKSGLSREVLVHKTPAKQSATICKGRSVSSYTTGNPSNIFDVRFMGLWIDWIKRKSKNRLGILEIVVTFLTDF